MLYTLTLFVLFLITYKYCKYYKHEFDLFHDLMKEIKRYLISQRYVDFYTAHSMYLQKNFVEHWEPLHWFRKDDNEYKLFAVTPNHLVHTLIVYFDDSYHVTSHDIINIEPFDMEAMDMYTDVELNTNGFFSK